MTQIFNIYIYFNADARDLTFAEADVMSVFIWLFVYFYPGNLFFDQNNSTKTHN